MRLACSAILVAFVALVGCGSPEQYQKQGVEADTSAVDMAIGLDVGDEHGPWAREFITTMGQSRAQYEAGDTVRAFHTADSLIAGAERSFDTLPFQDARSKFLLIMLTDLHSQVITWQELRGDTTDVRLRTERFQMLALRVRHMRDSLDRLP